jgi:hypothetical protein
MMLRMVLTLSLLVSGLGLSSPALAIPDPSYRFCYEMGYVMEDEHCVFPDGESCERWAFLNGECGQEYVHEVPCAQAGEASGVAVQCCEGLVELPHMVIRDGECQVMIGAYPVCSACGDGRCDDWENGCNCPQDCCLGRFCGAGCGFTPGGPVAGLILLGLCVFRFTRVSVTGCRNSRRIEQLKQMRED